MGISITLSVTRFKDELKKRKIDVTDEQAIRKYINSLIEKDLEATA